VLDRLALAGQTVLVHPGREAAEVDHRLPHFVLEMLGGLGLSSLAQLRKVPRNLPRSSFANCWFEGSWEST